MIQIRFSLFFFPIQLVEKALSVPASHRQERQEGACAGETRRAALPLPSLLNLFNIAHRYQGIRPNCLPTSLAQQIFLSRHGFSTKLEIGVRKETGKLKAHAWCENPKSSAQGFQPLEILNHS